MTLYARATKGDLIVVPGKGYNSTVWFGEIKEDFDPNFVVETRLYQDETVAARKVEWLPVALAKGQFNQRLIKLMQNRQSIIEVNQDADRREIYSRAYGDFIWKKVSGNFIRVTKQNVDLYDLNKAVDLTNYFAAQYLALKKGKLKDFLSLDFHTATDEYYDRAFFGDVSVSINSPGHFERVMKDAVMAAYVSAMLALSASGVAAQEASELKVINSANSTVSICDEKLEGDLRTTMEAYMNIHLWEDDICPRRKQTVDSVGLKTEVTVSVEP